MIIRKPNTRTLGINKTTAPDLSILEEEEGMIAPAHYLHDLGAAVLLWSQRVYDGWRRNQRIPTTALISDTRLPQIVCAPGKDDALVVYSKTCTRARTDDDDVPQVKRFGDIGPVDLALPVQDLTTKLKLPVRAPGVDMAGRCECENVVGATGDSRNLGFLGDSGDDGWKRRAGLDSIEPDRTLVRLRRCRCKFCEARNNEDKHVNHLEHAPLTKLTFRIERETKAIRRRYAHGLESVEVLDKLRCSFIVVHLST